MKVKFLNWIYKALNFLKDLSELIKLIIAIVAIMGTFGFGLKQCSLKKEIESNYKDRISFSEGEIRQYKDRNDELISEVKTLRIDKKELKKANKKAEYDKSKYAQLLAQAEKDAKASGLREKDLRNYIKIELESKGTEPTPLIFLNDTCNFEIKPIKTKHIQLDFEKKDYYLDVSYKYNASITTMLTIYPKRKANGKKYILNWGWLHGWSHSALTKIDDPNAKINNLVEIQFTK